MIRVDISNRSMWDLSGEGRVFFLKKGFEVDGDLKKVESDFYPHLKKVFLTHKFVGNLGDVFTLSAPNDNGIDQFIFVGVGELDQKKHENMEFLRRAIGHAVKELKRLEIKNALTKVENIDLNLFGLDQTSFAKQFITTILVAGYEFDGFKSKNGTSPWSGLVTACFDSVDSHDLENILFDSRAVGESVNFTRNLCDMPSNIATPEYVYEQARQVAEKFGFQCQAFGRDKAKELGMGGFVAVDEGSEKEGRFVEMIYSCGSPEAPTVALVGKGVTFDSGGLSLKPSSGMKGMKFDMCGAASVVGAMRALSQLKPRVNVVGLTPLVENMPSGRAARQDDIITHLNGVTTEIENTDAEGRLILADALAYAEKFHNPDVIIDIATLTGACVVALGHFFTGLMSKDDDLAHELIRVGEISGDWLWRLPLHDLYKPGVKSDVADISNTGSRSYGAGTIKAGMFLSHFVSKTPWAHLDIAGTESAIPEAVHLGKGASGVGVKLFVEFVLEFRKFARKQEL
ncbi:leucyl aminopeptidase [Candidatus Dependentiae bacterium]